MDHIKHQLFKLIAVWLLRLHKLSLFIQIRNFLLHNMKRKPPGHNVLQILHAEKIIQNHAEMICRTALCIFGRHQFRRHVIIFHNGRPAVFQTHGAHFLIRRSFRNHLGPNRTVCRDGGAYKTGIGDTL